MASYRSNRARGLALALAVTTVAFIATSDRAAAQSHTWDLQGQVGIGMPMGDLSDTHDPGISFGLGLSRWVSPRLAVHFGGAIEQLGGASDPIPDLTLYHFNGGLEFDLINPEASKVRLHANVGVGGTSSQADNVDNQTDFTVNGGLNLEYHTSDSLNLMVGPSLYLIMADETQVVLPIQVGFRYIFGQY